MSSLQCNYCKKFGHIEQNCWSKPSEARFAEENSEEDEFIFMTYANSQEGATDVWYLDSACSNHMTGRKDKFKDLDEHRKSQVRLGDNKALPVEGIINGKEKLLRDVHYVPFWLII